jgi:flagellar biosynthesis protein FlhG
MAIEKVVGIAVVSGKGGVGKSVIALNLALAIGRMGLKTLLFDAAHGDLANLANVGKTKSSGSKSELMPLTENVNLYVSAIKNPYSVAESKEIHRFLQEIIKATPGHVYSIFDCPTGISAISQVVAGLSEKILITSTPDPTSIAGSYILAKALYHEGMGSRCATLFNQVESSSDAVSLKTRFDILSGQFLKHKFSDMGFIRKDSQMARSVLEQAPLLSSEPISPSGQDITELAHKLSPAGVFHNATVLSKTHLVMGG